jgi:hypothetical protein
MPDHRNLVLHFLPPLQWARGFVGRLMADPAFVQKLVFEQLMAFSASMYYEWRVRGDQFKKVRAGHCIGQQRLSCLAGLGAPVRFSVLATLGIGDGNQWGMFYACCSCRWTIMHAAPVGEPKVHQKFTVGDCCSLPLLGPTPTCRSCQLHVSTAHLPYPCLHCIDRCRIANSRMCCAVLPVLSLFPPHRSWTLPSSTPWA